MLIHELKSLVHGNHKRVPYYLELWARRFWLSGTLDLPDFI